MGSLYPILIVCFLAYSSKGDDRCDDKNAHFVACGTPCQPTCSDVETNCNPMCVAGCECLPGFVLHESKCIRKEDCPHVSHHLEQGDDRCDDKNAHFVACGTPCQPTCSDVETNCNPMCVAGCECLPGFVLHESKCIRKEDCPYVSHHLEQGCGDANAEYTTCGTNCPATCEHPEETGCDDSCFVGCQCKKGYLLHGSMCVRPHQCP